MQIRLSTPEQENLVVENHKLVHYLLKQMKFNINDYDDLVSIGTIGLIKAAATFNQSKNTKFASYACQCIRNEFLMHFRKEKTHVNAISLDDTIIANSTGESIALRDIIPATTEDIVNTIEERAFFIKCVNIILNALKGKKRIAMLYTLAGYNQQMIAKELDVSQSLISRIVSRGKYQLMYFMNTEHFFMEEIKMSKTNENYQIAFSSTDSKNFNCIFSNLLDTTTYANELPDFQLNCTKERVIIRLPAEPASFTFLARIVKEIDEFNMSFISRSEMATTSNESKTHSSICNTESKESEMQTALNEPTVTDKETTISTSSPSHANSAKLNRGVDYNVVKNFILSLDSFSSKELRDKFPNISAQTINNAVYQLKIKKLITCTEKGEYIVNKT